MKIRSHVIQAWTVVLGRRGPRVRAQFVMVLAALALTVCTAPSRALACVVGTGTGASCTESGLNDCLPIGGSFDGTVTFDCGAAATITVTSTKTISADTAIDGGSAITISGGNSVRVFSVKKSVNFTVQNLAIANGKGNYPTGGGIDNFGTLTVTNSTFSGNNANNGGGIYNDGTLTVTNSIFSGNSAPTGGGIYNDNPGADLSGDVGPVTVTNCTFSGNNASSGGGIKNENRNPLTVTNSTFTGNAGSNGGGGIDNGQDSGTVTVTNCAFASNTTTGNGGGISGDGKGPLAVTDSTFSGNTALFGGGISNSSGHLTVTNSTFSGNSATEAGGGISNFASSFGSMRITNCTFFHNSAPTRGGGGINDSGSPSLTLTNTIVANNTGGNCAGQNVDNGVALIDGGHNIDDGTTCGFAGTGCTSSGGSSLCSTNPMLDSAGLANNDGPTQTIALEPGSPAIDAGDESVCAAPPVNSLDQRGYGRPGAGATRCSIGAYEHNAVPASPTPTPTPPPTPTGNRCVVGIGTEASCTESALDACLPGGASFSGTVTFDCGGAARITVTSTKNITADTTIDGGTLITISGGNTVGVFSVKASVNFAVENLTIANGTTPLNQVSGGGGGIYNAGGTVTVTNSTLSDNTIGEYNHGSGGGIFNASGTLTVTASTFSGNSVGLSSSGGGAIYNGTGTVNVTNSTFSGNSAPNGGGIENDAGGTMTVSSCTFSGNSGDGIYSVGQLTVTDSSFSDNDTGISNGPDGTLALSRSTVAGNGDGIDSVGTQLTVTDSTFSSHYGSAIGVGVFAASSAGMLNVTNSTFSRNYHCIVFGRGQAITGTVTNSTFFMNYGANAIGSQPGDTLTVTNSTFAGNSAHHGSSCDGLITDGGHNIDDGTTCLFTGAGCTSTGGNSFCNTNPQLDPAGLANNGGPTQTIALEPGSPAIDAGDQSVCAAPPVNSLDQRGYVRPGAGVSRCSIGAYEYNAQPPGPTPTPCTGNCATPSPTLTPTATAAASPTPAPIVCVGDCDGRDGVTVNEIIILVNMALGSQTQLSACPLGLPADIMDASQVDVSLIIQAVNNALNGCGG